MKSDVQGNIDALSRAIIAEAEGEAETMVAEAQARADAIRQQTQQQSETVRKQILDRAMQEANQIHGQTIATTQLKARTLQLDHREKMLDKVFNTARQELTNIQKWTDYPDIAQTLLREAVTQLRGRAVAVRADAYTQSVLSRSFIDELSREFNIQITMGEALAQGTGVIVEADKGHLQYDNTLETRLHRMQNNLRSTVYHLLMGEAQ